MTASNFTRPTTSPDGVKAILEQKNARKKLLTEIYNCCRICSEAQGRRLFSDEKGLEVFLRIVIGKQDSMQDLLLHMQRLVKNGVSKLDATRAL